MTIRHSWRPATDNVGVVGYEVEQVGVGIVYAAQDAFWDDLDETIGTFRVRAVDAASNKSVWSDTIRVRDVMPPSRVTGLSVQVLDHPNGVKEDILTWNASTDNVGVTAYRVKRATNREMTMNVKTLFDTVTVLEYSVFYTTAETKIVSMGMDGVVEEMPENMPVPQVTGLTATPSYSWVGLNWNLVTGVAGYHIYQDGLLIATMPSTSSFCSVTEGLTNDVTYSFTIEAFDDTANVGPMSAPVLGTPFNTIHSTPLPITGCWAHIPSYIPGANISCSWNQGVEGANDWPIHESWPIVAYRVYLRRPSDAVPTWEMVKEGAQYSGSAYSLSSPGYGIVQEIYVVAVDSTGVEGAQGPILTATKVSSVVGWQLSGDGWTITTNVAPN